MWCENTVSCVRIILLRLFQPLFEGILKCCKKGTGIRPAAAYETHITAITEAVGKPFDPGEIRLLLSIIDHYDLQIFVGVMGRSLKDHILRQGLYPASLTYYTHQFVLHKVTGDRNIGNPLSGLCDAFGAFLQLILHHSESIPGAIDLKACISLSCTHAQVHKVIITVSAIPEAGLTSV